MIARIRVYNDYEIMKLLENPNVVAIKNRSQIIYSNDFKYKAVLERLTHPEKTARQIFEEEGFDMTILSDTTPQKRICYWLKKYEMFGIEYFQITNQYTYTSKKKQKLIIARKSLKEMDKDLKAIRELLEEDK
ncbi:MAG: hypothetical protein Q4E75_01595 [bacterium]|nr:hypothetical protein [bacterium]